MWTVDIPRHKQQCTGQPHCKYTLSHFENGRDVITRLYMRPSVLTSPFCSRPGLFLRTDKGARLFSPNKIFMQ